MEAIRDKRLGRYNSLSSSRDSENKLNRTRRKALSRNRSIALKKYFILTLVISSFILLLSLVVGYTKMVNINSEILVKKIENSEIEMTISEIEKEMEPYISNKRIEQIASSRLGMIYPSSDNIVKIDSADSEVAETDNLDALFSLFD